MQLKRAGEKQGIINRVVVDDLCSRCIIIEAASRFYISSRHAAYKVTSVEEVVKIILNYSAETRANAQGKE